MRPIVRALTIGTALAVVAGLGAAARGAEKSSRAGASYARDIKPLLSHRCYACHGALQHKAGLRLDTAALMLKGGESGPAIEPGKSGESLIIDMVTGESGTLMPPEGQGTALTSEEIARLKAWIDRGAPAPKNEQPQPDPRSHWAFRGPIRPAVPLPTAGSPRAHWARNPIDAFLLASQEKHGLAPAPRAEAATLLRRVYLDLIGLAPTPEEVDAFRADPSREHYEAIVDRLLTSPQYGERWGRHWMDVWRYSDWDGYGAEVRESQPHIWRWRDWIVSELNRDRPYDQMVVAMLAADEASPDDRRDLPATGFLVRNWYKFNRNVWLENTVEHTAKAFLGVTLNCAKCHDHKYDPFGQSEYYAFRAFFEPHEVRTDRVPGQPDTARDGLVHAYDANPKTPTYVFRRGNESDPLKKRPVQPSPPRVLLLAAKMPPIEPVALPAAAYYAGARPFVREEALSKARGELEARRAALAAAEKTLTEARDPAAIESSRGAAAEAKTAWKAAEAGLDALEATLAADAARYARSPAPNARALAHAAARLQRKRDVLKAEQARRDAELTLSRSELALKTAPKDANAQKALAAARAQVETAKKSLETVWKAQGQDAPDYAPLAPVYPASSTGRRLALARWIAHPDNPLTARVAVNQIWMHHFGSPLVPTLFDFGRNGTPPTHPELLDWLAVALRDGGWRMKPLHRLIVTSSAYQMASTPTGPNDPNLKRDPANVYYWRMNARRMEAEIVRDNVLRAAGHLSQAIGGPDIDPKAAPRTPRRSIYFRHAKEKRVEFLRLFDSANVLACYRRSESVVPHQALALANSEIAIDQARGLAKQLWNATPEGASADRQRAFVAAAFQRVLGRTPNADEARACLEYLDSQARRLADAPHLTPFSSGPAATVPPAAGPEQRAREDLVHVLFNHNDFVTIR